MTKKKVAAAQGVKGAFPQKMFLSPSLPLPLKIAKLQYLYACMYLHHGSQLINAYNSKYV